MSQPASTPPATTAETPKETIQLEHVLNEDDECFLSLIVGSLPGTPKNEAHCGDVLLHGFCGYWAYGVKFFPGKGWLVCESNDDPIGDDVIRTAVKAFRSGEELPEGFWRFDRDLAKKALAYGLSRWGTEFVDGTRDYGDYDTAVQMALFGEVVYG